MLVPVILASDVTTASSATGQNDYYPLYASVGNLQNRARRSHKEGVVLLAYLAMPQGKIVSTQCDHRYLTHAFI